MIAEPMRPPVARSRTGWFVVLFTSLFVLDQVSKLWARTAAGGFQGRSISSLWPGVFELKLVFNEGIAFGLLQGFGVLLAPVAIAIAFFAGSYSMKHPQERPLTHWAMALLAAGAIGNLFDRLAFGRVTDMFWIRAINFPVFNLADVWITFAAVFLCLGWIGEALASNREKQTSETTQPQER